MRDFPRFALTAVVLVFVLSALPACDEKDILKRMEARSKSLKTLNADITMERYNAQLNESDVFKGTLVYVPQKQNSEMAARVDWVQPIQETAVVNNKQYILYLPRLKQAYTGSIDKPETAELIKTGLAFLNMSREKLKADYDIKYVGREKMRGGIKAFHLEFTPKAKQQYKTVEVWADKEGIPVSVKVTMHNADSTTIAFSNVKKNVSVNAEIFSINLPKSVKIIKN